MKTRIALIDHGEELSQIEEALAGRPEYQISPCPLAGDTIACIRQASPDVIVVLMQTPEAAGLNFIRLLRTDPATVNLPILLCTSKAPVEQPLVAELQGQGIHVLYRPFSAEELQKAIEQASAYRPPSR